VSYQVFARKYRPQTFDDVLGQDHVVRTLKNAIAQNRLAHAYLFVGPRGTGKTSTARIFAKALNGPGGPKVDFDPNDPICKEIAEGINLDVLEIDGASNNGVDQVRELRETVKYAPTRGKFKIYYIDEVHMLSTAAFNALLKTLEEPPPHVKFIFATTEANKILPTIISRCQRFDLRRIPAQLIASHLLEIARKENVKLDENAAYAIAKGADGGMRDAQSMLDQLVAFCGDHIKEENVLEIFGFTSLETIADLTGHLMARGTSQALELIYAQSELGKDLSRVLGELISYLRNILVAVVDPKNQFTELAPEIAERVRQQTTLTTPEKLLKLIDHFAETETRMKWATNKRLHLEIAMIKAVQILTEMSLSEVIELLGQAGELAGGLPTAPVPAPDSGAKKKPEAVKPEPVPAPAPEPKPQPVQASVAEPTPPPSPVAPPPVPAPEPPVSIMAPEEEEEEVTSPMPGIPLSGAALWNGVVTELARQERHVMAGYARSGVFLDQTASKFIVGMPVTRAFDRDSLMREQPRLVIERLLKELGGVTLALQCELRKDLPDQPASAPEPEFDEPEPEPAPPVRAVAPAPSRPAAPPPVEEPPAPVVEEAVQAAEPVDEVAFLNDPLIKDALRLFEAEVEKP